ncbi:hypothetical protein DFP73DRAFT_546346 [Morchella snyderi]|nr:hypothetical protein DFP73DRAFT_546346 [Morchella snyderi]
MLLQWQLSSGAFVLPSGGGEFKVLSYNQSLSLLPVCDSDSYTTVTWSIHACISSPFERQDEEAQPINWFKLQHENAARNMFATTSRSWFGPVSTDQEIAACPTNDSRTLIPSKLNGAGRGLKELSLAPVHTITAVVSTSVSAPVPTTTFKTSYPLVPLPLQVSYQWQLMFLEMEQQEEIILEPWW